MSAKGIFGFLGAVALALFASGWIEAAEKPPQIQALVVRSTKNDVSPALRNIQPTPPVAGQSNREIPLYRRPPRSGPSTLPEQLLDPVIQEWHGAVRMPAPNPNFEGVSDDDNQAVVGFRVVPPDTNGDVGPNHYVQWVNVSFAIYDKTGTRLFGPAAGNTFWTGFGGPCETTNDGDPIILYDHLADRWMVSQFAVSSGPPSYQCIAISQTNDPTGAYHRYEFQIPANKFNDYPKFGVWPDGYYVAVNQFIPPFDSYGGQGVAAFERDKMLDGQPAQMVYFDLFDVNPDFFGALPADLDGAAPAAGTPNFFVAVQDNADGWPADQLALWEFHVNWANPASSTFGVGGLPNATLPTAVFESNFGLGCTLFFRCIPQRFPGERLDAISDRLMYRLQFRNFSDHQSLVTNHTVDADGTNHAGIRWYELRNSGAGWTVHQQGTYAPDTQHRWMGSIAMDRDGNMALGFSVSSRFMFPSIRYVGRLASDLPGTMPQGETRLMPGGGAQVASSSRWGDYSMMAVDPDGCTFWYTQEYYANTGSFDWRTRVGAFRFPSCLPD